MNSTDIPPEWEEIRAMVALACGPTVIVGGALRDLDNGRPVKDLDLFVLMPPILVEAFDPGFYENQLRRTVPGLEVIQQLPGSYCDFRDEVFHVITCRILDFPHDVQVIFAKLDTAMQAIDRVDFGLCQIGWDGSNLIMTAAYLRDRDNQQFSLYRAPSAHHLRRSIDRHKRFQAKYPGWRFIDRTLKEYQEVA